MITPMQAKFVEIEEECNLDVNIIKLIYNESPPEQEFAADLYRLLMQGSGTIEPPRRKQTAPNLRYNVAKLLTEMRLISFS